VQALGDGVSAVVNQIDESTDFGEGERGETSMEGWGGGLRFGWLVGSIVLLVQLFVSLTPPFLAVCAMTARKVWASMARVTCRCQASQVRTW
jgi:hypothetical protein